MMFYEIINEYCKVTNQKSVWRSYGEDFYRQVYSFGKRDADWKDRSLYLLKDIANKLNVPVSFVMSITNYEGLRRLTRLEELQKKLQEVQKRKFFNDMIDRWSKEDFELDDQLFNEEQELKKQIEIERKLLKDYE